MKLHHNTIQNYTGLSKAEYERILVTSLMMCLSGVSKSNQHLQMLLIDKPINKWFLKQVSKINKEFIKSVEPYKNLSETHLKLSYIMFVKQINKNYPSVLIKKVMLVKKPFKTPCLYSFQNNLS